MSLSHLRAFGILVACIFPSLLTLIYFVFLADSSSGWQQGIYAIGKVIQFTFPLWFLAWILKTKINPPFKIGKGTFMGVLFALGIGFLMMGLINSPVFTSETISSLQANIEAKVTGLGITTIWSYLILGIFYSLIHSLLEEFYWRWFVFGQMMQMMRKSLAIILSSLGFMAHHVIVLAIFFGWQNPLTYFLSLAIALGGIFWAWQYEQSQSLLGPWLSHLIVDAAIFYVGYQLIQF